VADAAAVPDQLALGDLPQRAVALRAREPRRRPRWALGLRERRSVGTGHDRLLSCLRRFVGEPRQRRADLGGRQHRVDLAHRAQRALGHARHGRLARVLDDHGPAGLLDHQRAQASVPEATREDDRDRTVTIGARERAQHRIDGRANAVLLRSAPEPQPPVGHGEVTVGRRDVDATGVQALAVVGHADRQLRPPVKDVGEQAATGRGHVQHDADRRPEVDGQHADDLDQRLDASGRGADPDHAGEPGLGLHPQRKPTPV
jgi:hypothetical protein